MTAATLATTAASCIAVSAASAALVDFSKCQYQIVKQKLLEDKTTGRRFIDGVNDICTRVEKSHEEQSHRTKKRAEVFTPSWLCKKMNDFIWAEIEGEFLTQSRKGAEDAENWKKIVDIRVLEITCGEAPFIVSRYDAATGEMIPVENRIGILDRKLAKVNENAADEKEWFKWAVRAFESVYGYEYQRDSLAIARANLFLTFTENLKHRWNREATKGELCTIANRIAWNFWLMDGLKGVLPPGEKRLVQSPDWFSNDSSSVEGDQPLECVTYDWRARKKVIYNQIGRSGNMKFDFAIGNPPYQEESIGENKTYAPPVYDKFMDATFKVAEKVELITPARFLFGAGSTAKAWNRKMLKDPHLKVLWYEADSAKVFANTDIKGGVVVTYRDSNEEFGAIEHFIVFDELRSIANKVLRTSPKSLNTIIYAAESYRFTEQMHNDFPQAESKLSKGHKYDFKTSVFESLGNMIFWDDKPEDGLEYVEILGLRKLKRTKMWIRKDYIDGPDNFETYKVFVPGANGSGALGEKLTTPLIGEPLIGVTQTFISVGRFKNKVSADACLKYIKTKFCRVLLGILKITQHNPGPKWRYVPLQDFTSKSDIDWSVSVAEIDKQLYRKYNLSKEEIKFIEEKVRAME